MKALVEMGFTDVAKNKVALANANGDLVAAVQFLLE